MKPKHALTTALVVSVLATLGAQSSPSAPGDGQGADIRGGSAVAKAAARTTG